MESVIIWFQSNWDSVIFIIGAVVSIATVIVKITPTTKDDTILAKIIKVLSAFSLCNADGSFTGKGTK
jgi:hypothetical protein